MNDQTIGGLAQAAICAACGATCPNSWSDPRGYVQAYGKTYCNLRCQANAMSTWQPDIFGRGSRSVAEQPELFPADLGSKPKPVVVEPPDPDQLDLFAD